VVVVKEEGQGHEHHVQVVPLFCLYCRLKRANVDVAKMMSFIGDLDMIRVRESEKVLLQEEAMYMR